MGYLQCDQTWRNFVTSAKFLKYLVISWGFIYYLADFWTYFGNFCGHCAYFYSNKWPNIGKIIYPSGHTGLKRLARISTKRPKFYLFYKPSLFSNTKIINRVLEWPQRYLQSKICQSFTFLAAHVCVFYSRNFPVFLLPSEFKGLSWV